MIDVQRDLSPAALVRAIEDNSADLLMAMGRAGRGEQREEPSLRWTIGGSPINYHNCVVRADLAPIDADEVIAASIQRMQERGVPGTWHVGPSMRPADLAQRLLAAGLTRGGSEPGMAADLHTLREEDLPAPAGLRIERVRDDASLATWSQTLAQGFGEGEREATWVAATYRVLGYDADAGPWLHYLARLDGKPVGTSTVFLGAGVAGVYFVMTVPEARGRGIGAASTLAGLLDARELGPPRDIHRQNPTPIASLPAGQAARASLPAQEVRARPAAARIPPGKGARMHEAHPTSSHSSPCATPRSSRSSPNPTSSASHSSVASSSWTSTWTAPQTTSSPGPCTPSTSAPSAPSTPASCPADLLLPGPSRGVAWRSGVPCERSHALTDI